MLPLDSCSFMSHHNFFSHQLFEIICLMKVWFTILPGDMNDINDCNWTIPILLIHLVLADSTNITDVRYVAMSAPKDVPFPRNIRCSHQKSSSLVCAIDCKEVGCLLLSVDGGNCFPCTLSPDVSTDATLPGRVYLLDRKAFLGKWLRGKLTFYQITKSVHRFHRNIYSICTYTSTYAAILQRHISLQWRHNEHDSLLNCLFRRRSKKTSKFRVTVLCEGNPPVTGGSLHQSLVTRKMFSFDDVIMNRL